MAFVRAQAWIDGIVVGTETMDQLERNIAAFGRPSLTDEQCAELQRTRPRLEAQTLDPARWPVIQ
jgi:aryl-alcohol dehydrogenase-like predicted oxidoreductase